MRRIGVLLDLSRVRPASCFGETGYMHSPFVNAFVEQVFASGLGLFVDYKTSPNTGYTRDPLQKHATIHLCHDAPEILIRRQHITRFIKHGEPHAIRVCAQHLVVPPDHVPVVVVMDCVMPAERDGFRVEHGLVTSGDSTCIYRLGIGTYAALFNELAT